MLLSDLFCTLLACLLCTSLLISSFSQSHSTFAVLPLPCFSPVAVPRGVTALAWGTCCSLGVQTPAVVSCTSPPRACQCHLPLWLTGNRAGITMLCWGAAVLGCSGLLTVILEQAGNGMSSPGQFTAAPTQGLL